MRQIWPAVSHRHSIQVISLTEETKKVLTLRRHRTGSDASSGQDKPHNASTGPKKRTTAGQKNDRRDLGGRGSADRAGYRRTPRSAIAVGAQSRGAAALIVSDVEQGRSLAEALPDRTAGLDPRDQALVQEIVYGTLRNRRLLANTLQGLINHSIKEHFTPARALLLCGLYQLVYSRAPAHAVVAATVGACGLCHCKPLTAMVNAVLRRFLREGAHLVRPDDAAIEFSFPDWMYRMLSQEYGERVRDILIKSNEHAPMWLRVTNSLISTADYQKLLTEQGIEAEICPQVPTALRLASACSVDLLPHFYDGMCSVQDLAAQQCAPLLEIADGMDILDACAAPGGKSAHILDLGKVNLVCADADEKRLQLAEDTISRVKGRARFKVCDLAEQPELIEGSFDRILIDAPCSGSGVIRRHPDIKWLRRQKDIPELIRIQGKILDNALTKLRHGGILVYATCSIFKEENEEQIEAFLTRHNGEIVPLPFTGPGAPENYFCQRLPGELGGDGFFYSRIKKL